MDKYKELQQKRKAAIRDYRWNEIKKQWILWCLFAMSIILSIVCPLLLSLYVSTEKLPSLHAILTCFGNISFGYLSGFLVYLFGSFLPTTKEAVEINDGIYFMLCLISEWFDEIENLFLPENKKVSIREYENRLFNYLVVDANVTTNINDKDARPAQLLINRDNRKRLDIYLEHLKFKINELLKIYNRELKSSEVKELYDVAALKSLFDDITLNDTIETFSDKQLLRYIGFFQYCARVTFRKVCKEHERYKYGFDTVLEQFR